MSILSGYKRFKRHLLTNEGYILLSQWTSSNSVHFDDGNTAQTKVGAIDGITDSLTSTSSRIALSAKSGKSLQDQVTALNTDLGSKSAVSLVRSLTSGTKIGTITINGQAYDLYAPVDTNTWRGIQDSLTSTSKTDSLSANQGRTLNINKQDKIVTQLYTANTTSNYIIVAKTGYVLLAAYNIRDDTSYYVKGIHKRSADHTYTIIVDGVNNVGITLYLIWAKE